MFNGKHPDHKHTYIFIIIDTYTLLSLAAQSPLFPPDGRLAYRIAPDSGSRVSQANVLWLVK